MSPREIDDGEMPCINKARRTVDHATLVRLAGELRERMCYEALRGDTAYGLGVESN
jgi:hypothetical protein